MRVVLIVFVAIATIGCMRPEQPWAQTPTQVLGSGLEIELGAPQLAYVPPMPVRTVFVTVDHDIGAPTEIVGVLDFHSRAEDEDKGFDELRARAAALGADAVIDAEFEHGEAGELSHLSGLAVRLR